MLKIEREPTINGLLNFVAQLGDDGDLLPKNTRVLKSGRYVISTVVRTSGCSPSMILNSSAIDLIVDTFKKQAVVYGYADGTIMSYCSDFRTLAIMYHRWRAGDTEWGNEMRRSRTVNPCDVHSGPTFYGEGLTAHHIKLSNGMEITLKLPPTLNAQDAERIIEYVQMHVPDTTT